MKVTKWPVETVDVGPPVDAAGIDHEGRPPDDMERAFRRMPLPSKTGKKTVLCSGGDSEAAA